MRRRRRGADTDILWPCCRSFRESDSADNWPRGWQKLREEGIEPPTAGSGIQRSTTELFPRVNLRPAASPHTYRHDAHCPATSRHAHCPADVATTKSCSPTASSLCHDVIGSRERSRTSDGYRSGAEGASGMAVMREAGGDGVRAGRGRE